jgi:hypothetical protein
VYLLDLKQHYCLNHILGYLRIKVPMRCLLSLSVSTWKAGTQASINKEM